MPGVSVSLDLALMSACALREAYRWWNACQVVSSPPRILTMVTHFGLPSEDFIPWLKSTSRRAQGTAELRPHACSTTATS